MRMHLLVVALTGILFTLVAWLGSAGPADKPAVSWQQVAPGIFRTTTAPYGHALVADAKAILIDAPHGCAGLDKLGVRSIEVCLLTHHHRDTCAAAGALLRRGIKVRAAKAATEWLTPEGVRKYWQESLPLRNSRTAYLVVPVGLAGIDCSLEDGQKLEFGPWIIEVLATPGHSRDHLAFVVRKSQGLSAPGETILIAGDAISEPGRIWSPYTTDWDHWTEAGLKPAAQSLRKLAGLKPALVLPAHGPVLDRNASAALEKTAAQVEEVGFLKSFERYSKERLGNAPRYRFLAEEQKQSAGQLPWSRVSEHLFLTGNTYVLTSKDNAFLVLDPWGKRSVDQILKLKQDRKLGKLAVVMFSHAHYDHYDGIYDLPDRQSFQVWMLDAAAGPLADPWRWRAPFLDARPVKFDRLPRDGETLIWREYRFRFHNFPGQSLFTMAVETEIDGKKCWFTADNFFHQDMFSGSGGWMGLNRSFPLLYSASAQKVLDARPDWVLAEHGGPFEFNAEDFRRRVEWGKACARAADALSPSGNHRHDWDPHRVRVEPLVQKAKAGAVIKATLRVDNVLGQPGDVEVKLDGRGVTADRTWKVKLGRTGAQAEILVRLDDRLPPGRHVLTLSARVGEQPDPGDAFLAVDVE